MGEGDRPNILTIIAGWVIATHNRRSKLLEDFLKHSVVSHEDMQAVGGAVEKSVGLDKHGRRVGFPSG